MYRHYVNIIKMIMKTRPYLEFVLYSLQTAKKVFCFVENGDESRCISINHKVEDGLLSVSTDPFKLIWN